ncbi:hypothetical protein COOONC_11284 [Cooperia oncophora]
MQNLFEVQSMGRDRQGLSNATLEQCSPRTGNLKHTDFALFVAVTGDGCYNATLAFASHCSIDPKTRRPISGYMNICPIAFNAIQHNEMHQWLSTIKHELIHAFVFSPSHFQKFVGAQNATQ